MKHLLLGLLALTSVARAATLDETVSAIIKATESTPDSGVAVAIIHKGKIVLSKGYGFRDRERRLPVSSSTLFAIGSTTKAFTAVALSMAEADGLLKLDEPVRKYLPDFAMKDPRATAELNAIDMMSHRSGLPRHDLLWYLAPFTRENLVYRLRYLDPNPAIPFRTGYQYNNLMFAAAGYLLERVSGKPWEAYVKERIFEPLGMTETTTSLDEVKQSPDHAQPYHRRLLLDFRDISKVGPAGSIYSSASDLARWLLFHLSHGKTESGKTLLDAQRHERLFAPNIDVHLFGIHGKYGLGWLVNRLHGRRYIWHTGNIDGFSAHVSFLPEEQTGLVILMNQNGEASVNFDMPWRIYDAVLGPGPHDDSSEDELPRTADGQTLDALFDGVPPSTPADDWRRLTPAELRAYEGLYADDGYGELHIVASNGKLVGYYYGTRLDLSHRKGDEFSIHLDLKWTSADLPVAFRRQRGEVTALAALLEASAPPVVFRRVMTGRPRP